MTMRTDPSVQAFQHNAREQQAGQQPLRQTVAAAGATQGGATAINPEDGPIVVVTVTTSAQGVQLPSAALGRDIRVVAPQAKGVKVYPADGEQIQGANTNVAVDLVLNKSSIFTPISDTVYGVVKGA